MNLPLDYDERRALGRKTRTATLEALRALGGEAHRQAIRDWALAHGGFTNRELTAPAPEGAGEKYLNAVDHRLAWEPTNLKRAGLAEKTTWGTWRLKSPKSQLTSAAQERVDSGRLAELRAMSYQRYLSTPEWRRTRAAALQRAGGSCSLDITHTDRLEVHHRVYDRLGAERVSDLVVLCHSCHQLHHREYGLPRRESSAAPARPTATGDSLAALTSGRKRRQSRESSLLWRLLAKLTATPIQRPGAKI